MDTDSKYTAEQMGWLEGQYSDLQVALNKGQWAEAETIIKEVEAKEFWVQAADMKRMLSHEKYADQ